MEGNIVSLTKLRCDEADEMMGVWIATGGDKQKIIKKLKTAAVIWVGKIRVGNSSSYFMANIYFEIYSVFRISGKKYRILLFKMKY